MGDRTTWHHLVVWPGVQRRSSSSAHSPLQSPLLSTPDRRPASRRTERRFRRRLRNARGPIAPQIRGFSRARARYNNFTDRAAGGHIDRHRPPDSAESTDQLRSLVAGLDICSEPIVLQRPRRRRSARATWARAHDGMSASAVAWPGQPDASVRHLLACGRHRHCMRGERNERKLIGSA